MKLEPKAGKGAVVVRFVEGSLGRFDEKVLSVAYGDKKVSPFNRRKFVLLMRKVVAQAKQHRIKSLVVEYADIKSFASKDMGDYEAGRVAGTAFVMADYEHVFYKTKPKEGWNFVEAVAVPNMPAAAKEGFADGLVIAGEVNATRELSNTPGGDMTPRILAEKAKAAVKGTNIKVKILGVKEMQKLGMGAVLGVGKGAKDEPRFIVMEYKGGGKNPPVVLIGKGVTFDTGGIQVKPGDHMYEMHMDMSGGGAGIHALGVGGPLKIKANVIGLIPAVENAVGAGALRPGDILKSLSGKSIEILHTDAEGRVILADAITYAKRYRPAIVADAATLTGAALTALGLHASAVMTNREDIMEDIRALGEESGDYVWPFPLWEEYDDMVKGHFGDVPNISTSGNSRNGGVIAGGKFLEVFAKELDCPWFHFDIAPRMTSAPGEHLAKGAAGAPVRLFLALIEKYADQR